MIGSIVWKKRLTPLVNKLMSWKIVKLYALAGLVAFGFGVFLSWVLVQLASS